MKIFVAVFAILTTAVVAAKPSTEYLPPVKQAIAAPVNEYLPPAESKPAHELSDDGYRYRTVRRIRYRYRRDVSELPTDEYLPPIQETVSAITPVQEYLQPESVAVEPETLLTDDGYRYKTVRRLKYRQRRDVIDLPINEYLSPVEDSVAAVASTQEYLPPVSVAVEPETILADNGYRYKVVKKLKYRRH